MEETRPPEITPKIALDSMRTYSSKSDNPVLNFSEKTYQESAMVPESQGKPYNQDDIYQKTGDYSIYKEMREDDQASICLGIVKDLVLGAGFSFVSDDAVDSEDSEEVISALNNTFIDDLTFPLEERLEEWLSSYDFGFSLTEKMFKRKPDGTIGLKDLKTRDPDSWLIHTDERGKVIQYEQWGTKEAAKFVKPSSLIHYINKPLFQNPYGTSDLRPAYQAYIVKKHIVRYYSIFMEGFAKPIPVGRYDTNIPREARTSLLAALQKFQAKTALVIPKDIEMEFLEAKGNGDTYEKALNLFNMYIGRSMFCPDLLGFQGATSSSGGSQALGREQMDIFFRHIARKRLTLEKMVNVHLVKPIVAWNFGIIENAPKFKLNPITEDDAEGFAKLFLDAVKAKAYSPSDEEINHFRDIINFPKGEVERVPEPSFPGGNFPPSSDDGAASPDTTGGEGAIDDLPEQEEKELKSDGDKKNFAMDAPFKPTDTPSSQRFDAKKTANMLNANLAKINDELKAPVDFMFNDLIEQIEKKKILQGKPERMQDLKIKKLSAIKTILKSNLRNNFKDAKILAKNELFRRDFAEPLPSEEFLKFLDSETFDAVGKWDFYVDEQAKIALREAVKDGKNLPSVIQFLTDTKQKLQTRMDRYARTKLTETMNRGRVEFFNETGVVDGFEYSAILDDRTTDICRGLHGKKFAKGTEPIPPMHFNCRSVLIPITKFEDFTPTEKVGKQSVDSFIEDNKGEGFSAR